MKKAFVISMVMVLLLSVLSVGIGITPTAKAADLCPVDTPDTPSPTNSSTDISVNTSLGWNCVNASYYHVYFGTNSTPSVLVGNRTVKNWDPPAPLGYDTTYYWKIVAWDSCGNFSNSSIWNFTTECTTPDTPGSPSPNNGSTSVSVNADLDWGNCSNATYYQVYFDTNSSPVTLVGSPNVSNWTLSPLTSNTTYYWKVVARNGCGDPASGSIWSFTTVCSPGTPMSPDPADLSTNVSINADLDWGDSSDATYYQVYFDTNSSPVTLVGSPNVSNWSLPSLGSGTTYYWKVVARNNCSGSASSSIWRFTTECAALCANTSYSWPTNSSTGISVDTNLYWYDCSGASYYQVYCNTNSSPSTIVGSTNDTVWSLSNLSSNTKYYWKIVARDNCGGNSSGPIWNFTTGCATPSGPISPTPSNASTGVSTDADLDWGDCSYATYYQVYFGINSIPSTLVGSPNASGWMLPSLSVNTTYYWKVVAKSGCGGSTEGSVWSFTTGGCATPGTPDSPSPANASTGVSIYTDLDWGNSSSATYYQLYFDTDSSPSTLVGSPNASGWALPALSFNTTYYWKVVAKSGCGGSANGSIWSFTTGCAAPDKPASPLPALGNGSTNISVSVTLDWPDCANASSYDVYFNTSATPSYYANTSNSSYQLPQLNYSTKYYWKVVSKNICGNNSSDIWNFTTVSAPAPTPTISFDIGGTKASLDINSSGVVQQVVNITSADGNINMYIPAGTTALNNQSQPLHELNMSSTDEHPEPSGNRSVVAAFDFDPDGATFNPGIVVTLHYTHDMIPAGVNESSLIIAFYDETLDSWQYINGVVDPNANTITFTVNHFTVFTIQTPSIHHVVPNTSESAGLSTWMIVLIVLAAVIVLGLSGFLFVKRRRMGSLYYEDAEDNIYDEYNKDDDDFKF